MNPKGAEEFRNIRQEGVKHEAAVLRAMIKDQQIKSYPTGYGSYNEETPVALLDKKI